MPSDSANPYATPEVDAAPPPSNELRGIIIAWERLRLVYNGVLLAAGLGVVALAIGPIHPAGALVGAVVVALGANVGFFAGPLAELYAVAISRGGQWPRHRRLTLFGVGLLFSLGLFGIVALALG